MFSVSPSKFTVPAPLIGPAKANVPLPPAEPNVNKAPELTVHDPLPVPPPLMFSCPALARTCPVLLKVPMLPYTPLVVVADVPPDFWNVPVLLNVLLLPVNRYTKLSFWMSQVPELLMVDPFSLKKSPFPGLDVHPVVPPVFTTRPFSVNWLALEKVIPPLVVVVPCAPAGATQLPADSVVHMLPPVHVVSPLIVTVSVPASVPALWAKVDELTALPEEKFATPLLIVNAPTLVTVAGLTQLAVPPVTIVLPVTL